MCKWHLCRGEDVRVLLMVMRKSSKAACCGAAGKAWHPWSHAPAFVGVLRQVTNTRTSQTSGLWGQCCRCFQPPPGIRGQDRLDGEVTINDPGCCHRLQKVISCGLLIKEAEDVNLHFNVGTKKAHEIIGYGSRIHRPQPNQAPQVNGGPQKRILRRGQPSKEGQSAMKMSKRYGCIRLRKSPTGWNSLCSNVIKSISSQLACAAQML